MTLQKNALVWIFLGIFCVLLAPNLIYGVRESHDINFHMMLFLSYRDGVELGTLYPRWLPDQLQGLGSAALLIYPPLSSAFFVLVDFATLHVLAPGRVLGLGAVLLSIASAATFYVWAREYVSTRVAIVVALIYATAPYHMTVDLYGRGAMAEYTTYVWIPLIFLGIRKTILVGNARSTALLAASICALFLTHLLTSMLVAPLAVAYALICLRMEAQAGTRITHFMLIVFTAIVGVGLAAFYYVPAIALLPEANSSALYVNVDARNFYSVVVDLSQKIAKTNISSVSKSLVPKERFLTRLILLASAYFVIFLYLLLEVWNNWRKHRLFAMSTAVSLMWVVTGILCFALMCGMFPFVFRPPSPYAQIQFSWRLLVVMEFSLMSLFVRLVAGMQSSIGRTRLLTVGVLVSLALATSQFGQIATRFKGVQISVNPVEKDEQVEKRLSPIEYFPAGTKADTRINDEIKLFEQYALSSQPAFINGAKGELVSATRRGERFTVHSNVREPTPIMIQQFYFPGWKALDENSKEIAVFPDQSTHLASYLAPVGNHIIVVKRYPTRSENIGNAISIAALAVLALQLIFLWRRRSSSIPGA